MPGLPKVFFRARNQLFFLQFIFCFGNSRRTQNPLTRGAIGKFPRRNRQTRGIVLGIGNKNFRKCLLDCFQRAFMCPFGNNRGHTNCNTPEPRGSRELSDGRLGPPCVADVGSESLPPMVTYAWMTRSRLFGTTDDTASFGVARAGANQNEKSEIGRMKNTVVPLKRHPSALTGALPQRNGFALSYLSEGPTVLPAQPSASLAQW